MDRWLVRIQLVVIISSVLLSCEANGVFREGVDYDYLCEIYQNISRESTDVGMKDYAIAERVEDEMPDFYKRYFQDIMYMDRNKRYKTIKKLAEHDLSEGESWDCEVMRDYFEGKYDQGIE